MISVPNDFPRDVTPAALAGGRPKLAGRLINGRFVVGEAEEDRLERWQLCEDVAQQLVASGRKDAAKYPQKSREVVLKRIWNAGSGKGVAA